MQKNPTHILPTEVHTVNSLSGKVKRPKLRICIDRLFPTVPPVTHRRVWAVGLLAVAVAGTVLLWRWSGWGRWMPSGSEGGFHGGLPVLSPIIRDETDTLSSGSAEGEATEPIPPVREDETEPFPETGTATCPAESEATPPSEHPADRESEALPQSPSDSPSDDTDQPPAEPPSEPPAEPETESRETGAVTEPVADPPPEPETLPVPEGCFPVLSADVSEALRGAGYILNEGVALPSALPADPVWRAERPAVLIVNTHPYEGYHDGSPWFDPAQGGLSQTDSPNDPDGVVALSVALTRALRDSGVTVIHLRLPTTPEESSAELYDRTASMIRHYCRLYPDIGLVLDLRRSAELTEKGEILRTEGRADGNPCAQLRITVSGGRDTEALRYDLAAALALRESLWGESPALSRPVRVKNGSGLVPDLSDLRVLTLEMGAAGNTFAEAKGLVAPLARALDGILQKIS